MKSKKDKKKYPKVSFVICTLNCRDYLERCLKSIWEQDYPKNKIELIVVDSYSTDGTIEIARILGAKVILTKIRGYMEGKGMPKSIGCSKAKGDIIVTIDSDNALVEKDWIKKMIYPLIINKDISLAIGRMAVVKSDPAVNQYLSLVGTDPFAIYGSIDPQISLDNLNLKDNGRYYTYNLNLNNLLILGGYGIAYKRETLKSIGGYHRDVDNIYLLAKKNKANIAIVKDAHLHHLITTGIFDFLRKKIKWGKFYFNDKTKREFKWNRGAFGRFGKIRFLYEVIKDLIFFPELFVSLKMFINTKEKAWLYHAPMTFATTLAYIIAYIKSK